MLRLFKRTCICTLILIFGAGQAAAFDLQIGHMNFNPPANPTAGPYQLGNDTVGAIVTIPLGFSKAEKPGDTLNGQDLSRFTEQDTKDSLVVMGAIAVGVIAISGTLRPRACFFEYPVPGFNLKTATCGAIQW
jgi:hypothetical protein